MTAHAATQLEVSPNPSRSDQDTTMIATCDRAEGDVVFGWVHQQSGEVDSERSRATSTRMELKIPFEVGQYNLWAECNGNRTEYVPLLVNAPPSGPSGVSVSPQNPISGQATTLTTYLCPPSTAVIFSWDLQTDIVGYSDSPVIISDSTSRKAEFVKSDGFDGGVYNLIVKCSNELPREFMNAMSVTNPTLTFRTEPSTLWANDPESQLIVEGCPPNSRVHMRWEHHDSGFDIVNRYDDVVLTSDAAGVITHQQFQGFNPGDYSVEIACGGVTHTRSTNQSLAFNVSRTRPSPTAMIPPPSPVCDRFENGKCTTVNTPFGKISTDPVGFVTSLLGIVLSISGGIALVSIMYAGYVYMTSRGNQDALQKAKELITAAIVGLLFIIFSFVIFEFITDDILGIPGFGSQNNNSNYVPQDYCDTHPDAVQCQPTPLPTQTTCFSGGYYDPRCLTPTATP